MVCSALAGAEIPVRVIALQDRAASPPPDVRHWRSIQYRACHGSRPRFVRAALQARRARPRVILVGHPNFSPLGYTLARLCKARLCVFMYGVDVWEPLPPARRWALQQADQWIAISRFTAREAASANGLPLERIRILYNCLDPGLQPPTGFVRQESGLSLLTVARLLTNELYKGHDHVISALPPLLQRFPQLIYHIVGDGNGRPELEAQAARLGVAHAVRFHGFVDEAVMQRFYAESSVFIMPSRREGFGFVFIEAMAQGAPAIGGNMDATPEVIADGVTGYLVDPTSVDDIVDKTSRLLADADLRRTMGQAAIRHVQENFSYDTFRERLGELLGE